MHCCTCSQLKESISKESMASKPGILTNWPWKPLGSFKVVFLAYLFFIFYFFFFFAWKI